MQTLLTPVDWIIAVIVCCVSLKEVLHLDGGESGGSLLSLFFHSDVSRLVWIRSLQPSKAARFCCRCMGLVLFVTQPLKNTLFLPAHPLELHHCWCGIQLRGWVVGFVWSYSCSMKQAAERTRLPAVLYLCLFSASILRYS